ncbi:MAG: hypothetical protein C7B47_04000 [Sulfobacillus thermosulfidooxidans]|uniref:G5 domain-containing protein n=1 Tax=Sulfobacillus thermosulfidooxidans TaxID=28034 RepID=A0A2T2X2R8_SULTH|nr:MAG: hypothetical protein C7B47_04000 [Sulfobacillus thermosulfidooxidans]
MATWTLKAVRPWLFGALAATAIGTGLASTHYRPVSINVFSPTGNRSIKLWTFKTKVRNILAQAHIPLSSRDKVQVVEKNGNASISIREAVPVWVRTAHRHFKYWTTDYHVGSILSALGIKLGPLDKVRPPLTASIAPGSTVDVIRQWLVKKTITSSLPFTVTYRPDPNLIKGRHQVLQNGQQGVESTTIQYLVQDGSPLTGKVVAKKIMKSPSPEVIAYGTAQPLTVNGQALPITGELYMVSTGYWPNPAWSTGLTAMGTAAHYGIVAVDPAVIPLGTHLYIPGYGYAVAEDTGSAIVGNRIDLCFNDQSQAIEWGVRPLTVYILGN